MFGEPETGKEIRIKPNGKDRIYSSEGIIKELCYGDKDGIYARNYETMEVIYLDNNEYELMEEVNSSTN